MRTSIKTYSELITLPTFEERFAYLKLGGIVCKETFGIYRWINQVFYRSPEWKRFRREIILRDNGCDLGISGYEIQGLIIVHHLNPILIDDIVNVTNALMDPENAVCASLNTHNAVHYGDDNLLGVSALYPAERKPYDTCPWKGGIR